MNTSPVTNEDFERQKQLAIIENKNFRVALDTVLQQLKEASSEPEPGESFENCPWSRRPSRNRSLSITHLEDAIMRLGMDLKEIGGTTNPYPNSYKPENTIVDPTADGLKL